MPFSPAAAVILRMTDSRHIVGCAPGSQDAMAGSAGASSPSMPAEFLTMALGSPPVSQLRKRPSRPDAARALRWLVWSSAPSLNCSSRWRTRS